MSLKRSWQTWARYNAFTPASLASRSAADHFQTGDTDV